MAKSQDEVAAFFDDIIAELTVSPSGNAPEMIYPGYPGIVAADGKLGQMNWGFPLSRKGAKGQPLKPKPVNNTRSDKLSSPFWLSSFHDRRCLIPVSSFAEAEGPRGGKTRTWFSQPDAPLMAMAGIWRDTAEWGPAYSMIMTEANETVSPVHNRMPVILPPSSWPQWLEGSPQDAFELCSPFVGPISVTRTDEPWVARR